MHCHAELSVLLVRRSRVVQVYTKPGRDRCLYGRFRRPGGISHGTSVRPGFLSGDREPCGSRRRLRTRAGVVLARLEGTAARYGYGNRTDASRGEAIAELHAISTDPVLLGLAAGSDLASRHEYKRAGADLLREAGADMQVAEASAKEVRERLAKTRYPDGIRSHRLFSDPATGNRFVDLWWVKESLIAAHCPTP